jgi:hypothetical protein
MTDDYNCDTIDAAIALHEARLLSGHVGTPPVHR